MEVLHYSASNAVEIRNGIMFDFYPGLPHMPLCTFQVWSSVHLNAQMNVCVSTHTQIHSKKEIENDAERVEINPQSPYPGFKDFLDTILVRRSYIHKVLTKLNSDFSLWMYGGRKSNSLIGIPSFTSLVLRPWLPYSCHLLVQRGSLGTRVIIIHDASSPTVKQQASEWGEETRYYVVLPVERELTLQSLESYEQWNFMKLENKGVYIFVQLQCTCSEYRFNCDGISF